MARRRKNNVLEREVKKAVQRGIRRRGGLLAVIAMLVLAVIGFFSPELRERASNAITPYTKSVSVDDDAPLSSKVKSPLKEGTWPVVHIADGDTLDVRDADGNKHRIRLVGADTPEVVKPNHPVEPFGPEASAFTKKMIAAAGARVRIAFDGDQIDRYGRNLGMVYLPFPGEEILLNELLIREGLARARLQYRFSKGAKERFQQAEEEARSLRKGIWSLEDSGQ